MQNSKASRLRNQNFQGEECWVTSNKDGSEEEFSIFYVRDYLESSEGGNTNVLFIIHIPCSVKNCCRTSVPCGAPQEVHQESTDSRNLLARKHWKKWAQRRDWCVKRKWIRMTRWKANRNFQNYVTVRILTSEEATKAACATCPFPLPTTDPSL